MIQWAYYLHINGDIISKNTITFNDIEGDFVVKKWLIDTTDRTDAWKLVLEALVLGASIDRVKELSNMWGLDYEDSLEFITRTEPTEILKEGFDKFVRLVLGFENYDAYEKVTLIKENE